MMPESCPRPGYSLDHWPWDFKNDFFPFSFGDSEAYENGMQWLDVENRVIEDWGCGTAWARQFVHHAQYIGVDGASSSRFVDKITNLVTYQSTIDAIFMRGVLEHNYNWRVILENAMSSFQWRMVLVTFIPLTHESHDRVLLVSCSGIPDIALNQKTLMPMINPYLQKQETIISKTEYGSEVLWYLEKVE